MNVIETKIEGLLILEPRVFGDDRGWFMESFNQKTFEQILKERNLDVPQFVRIDSLQAMNHVFQYLTMQNHDLEVPH